MGVGAKGSDQVVVVLETTGNRMTSTGATNKPFWIEKRQVYEAYKAVKSNRGAAGVDGQTLEMFEKDLAGNLYKIWNRMSSGTYFPPPVRAVSIPKKTGGERILGVPTVGDRIAQMVVKRMIEPDLEPIFLLLDNVLDSITQSPIRRLSCVRDCDERGSDLALELGCMGYGPAANKQDMIALIRAAVER